MTEIGFICSFQFSKEKPQLLMISSEDSKLHIFDGVVLIHKYKGKQSIIASFFLVIYSIGEDQPRLKILE